MNKSNKKQYFQTFKESYSVDFPCILKSRKGEKFAFCTVCGCDINIAHGGKNDLSNHVKCGKHISYVKSKEDSKKINTFFAKSGNVDSDVIRAECLFTSFLVEHNVPLSAADHAGALFKKMFPTSEVAKKYSCGRTKTTCIVNKMAKNASSEVVKCLQNGPDTDKSLFFSSVRNYFYTACDYIINKFPLKDDVLKNAQVARLDKIEDAQLSSIRFFLEKFPIMLCKEENETTDEVVNELQRQFTALQVDDTLAAHQDAASDSSWAQISRIRGADGLLKYNRISRVLLSILTIPHSNAECERFF